MHLNTTEALRAYMASVKGEEVSDGDLIWFVCMLNASMHFDCGSVKDLASVYLMGVAPATFDDVQYWLDVQFELAEEGDEESFEYGDDNVKTQVDMFYGK